MSTGKIGIFLPGGHGDIMTAMSVLKYKDELWPGKEIWWFCSPVEAEVLKYAPVEVKAWEDFTQLIVNKNRDNGLHDELRKNFDCLKELEKGYFPAPWMYEPTHPFRINTDYPNISKKVFGVAPDREWHPMLYWTDEEKEMVREFCSKLPHRKTIMLETGSRSKQTTWHQGMTKETMRMCRERLGPCNFIFASKGDGLFDDPNNANLIDDPGVVTCENFTIRQTALMNNYADLFIGISSGISVATSCWGNKPTPKIQYTNVFQCSTQSLANGPFSLIEIHAHSNPEAVYYRTLNEWLGKL